MPLVQTSRPVASNSFRKIHAKIWPSSSPIL